MARRRAAACATRSGPTTRPSPAPPARLSTRPLPSQSLFGEDRVELPLRLDQHLERSGPLLLSTVEANLAEGIHDPEDRVAVVLRLRHGVVAELAPRRVF